ncbi:hypothetical protein J5N97_004245 [Dioscorea zingiberensis]|uniref:Uncharacterized protein n=1 Tax=Dioscorea zingiberensis TaxID=325984 RepID=A0A9D5D6X1_9LILI|nr:hypothetical protein J5N97_004245 [Dioscorea zingiberensis]
MSGSSGQKKSHKGYSRLARQWSMGGSYHKKEEINETSNFMQGVVKSKSRRSVSSSSKEMKAHPVLKAMEAPKIDKALMKPEFLRVW